MTRVLLTGAAGQLGTDIVAAASRRSDIELVPTGRDTLDITDLQATSSRVAGVAPQVIIHGAAYTAVDDCESNEDLSLTYITNRT